MSVPHSLPTGCEPTCHGCRHRQLDEAASLAQKASYLARVLGPWTDRIAPVTAPAPARHLGYRDRVTLTARWDAATGWRFGLMRRDELIAIHDCPVHSRRVRDLVQHLVRTLPAPDALPLAYLHVAGAQATLIVKAHAVDVERLAVVLERPSRHRGALAAPASGDWEAPVCTQRMAAAVGTSGVS